MEAGPDYSGTVLTADSLIKIVNTRALNSVRGSGDLVVRTPELGRPRTLQVSLVAERPDRARLRGRAGAFVSVFDLLVDQDSLKLYLPRDRVLVAEALESGGALPALASREVVPALLAGTLRQEAIPEGGFQRTAGGYEVVQEEGEGDEFVRRRFLFEKDRLRLVHQSIERRLGGRMRTALINYTKHEVEDGHWFPRVVRLDHPESEESLELRFLDSINLNHPIDPGLFVMEVPPGTRRVGAGALDDSFLGDAPAEDTEEKP